jgi:hypothetical protein
LARGSEWIFFLDPGGPTALVSPDRLLLSVHGGIEKPSQVEQVKHLVQAKSTKHDTK